MNPTPRPTSTRPGPSALLRGATAGIVAVAALVPAVGLVSLGTAAAAHASIPSSTTANFPVLQSGSTGTRVTVLQDNLNAFGYNLAVDGSFGASTASAVTRFQSSHALASDGVVGQGTWAALLSTVQASSTTAWATRAVQTGVGTSVDGVWGSGTTAAVKAFQGSHHLAQDGVVGPATWGAILQAPTSTPVPAGSPGPDTRYPNREGNYAVNGRMAASEVCSIAENPNWKFSCRGVKDWNALDTTFHDRFGIWLPVEGGGSMTMYRTYAQQQALYTLYLEHKGSLAAKPGTSDHGWGRAADISVASLTATQHGWLNANAASYGFVRDVATEDWHFHYTR